MPGIFDVLAANGILSALLGGNQPQARSSGRPALDTPDDTPQMMNRQRAMEQGGGSVTNPRATLPAGSTPARTDVPMIVQAMENQGVPVQGPSSYLPPDAEQEMAQAEIDPRTIAPAQDPFANTYNAAASAFQDSLPKAQGMLESLGIKTDMPLRRLGYGLMAAGSRDPAGVLAQLREIESGRKPKVTPLKDGAFSMITMPDGSVRYVKNEEVAQYMEQVQDTKAQQRLLQTIISGQLGIGKAAAGEQLKTAGDATSTSLAVAELESIADALGKTDTATGPAIGVVPKWARDIVTPEGADLQDRAERIIQASLRQTLGAQFTEKEAFRFLERAYNPRLDEKTNAARLRQIAKELGDIQSNKDAAIEYMKQNGTLEGFKPPPSNRPGRSGGEPAKISSEEEWASLPSGTQYVGPDGKLRTKR